jgi:SAM-dependent methyltransferase
LAHCAEKDGRYVWRDNSPKRKRQVEFLLRYNFDKKRVLEIGCGTGVLAHALTWSGAMWTAKYQAVDVSPANVTAARDLIGIDAQQAMAHLLPFGNETFDAVIMMDVLEHIDPSLREASFKEISRVLKPHARIFINNPLSESHHAEGYDWGFTDNDILDLAKACGAKVESITPWSAESGRLYFYEFIVLRRPRRMPA